MFLCKLFALGAVVGVEKVWVGVGEVLKESTGAGSGANAGGEGLRGRSHAGILLVSGGFCG